jgi:hypothetical protein
MGLLDKTTKGGMKMKKKLFTGLVIGLLVLGMAEVVSAYLITNGSFEAGSFIPNTDNAMSLPVGSTQIVGWTVMNGEIAWINTPNSWGIIGSDGNFFLDLVGYHDSAPYGEVSQIITSTVGQRYTLSFDLGTDQSNPLFSGPISVLASAGNTSQPFVFNPTGNGSQWQTFSLDFVATSPNTPISIVGTGGKNYIGLDNVSVAPVPVPSTMLLFGTGLIGLAGLGRKKFLKK